MAMTYITTNNLVPIVSPIVFVQLDFLLYSAFCDSPEVNKKNYSELLWGLIINLEKWVGMLGKVVVTRLEENCV